MRQERPLCNWATKSFGGNWAGLVRVYATHFGKKKAILGKLRDKEVTLFSIKITHAGRICNSP